MMTEDLKARVSYLRGFAEGLDLGEESKEQKILQRMIVLLEEMTDEIEQLRIDYEELFEYAEAIDDDLSEMENDFYDEEDEGDDADELGGPESGFSIECPACREIVTVDDDILDADSPIEVICPACGEAVLSDDEDWDGEFEDPEEEGGEDDKPGE